MKIKIGWREYEVIEEGNKITDNGELLFGQIDYEMNRIVICSHLPECSKRPTLLHEVFHGIFYLTGRVDDRRNEGLIEALSENLYQVIRDNPEFVEWLQK